MTTTVKIPDNPRLLGSSQKVVKGEKRGFGTAVMYLAASDRSKEWGGGNTCPMASPGCREACLGHTAGRLQFGTSQAAQIWKTYLFFNEPDRFFQLLGEDIQRHVTWCRGKGLKPAVRLNGSSDIVWEARPEYVELFAAFHDVQFYDYTKIPSRFTRFQGPGLRNRPPTMRQPKNYHLTFSRSETNDAAVRDVVRAGGNVAVVFGGELPETYLGRPVIDGDETDLRFLDPRPCVVGLSVKGHVRDETGFVVYPEIQRSSHRDLRTGVLHQWSKEVYPEEGEGAK